jgi:putative DNA methylase
MTTKSPSERNGTNMGKTVEVRTYDPAEAAVFCKTTEQFGGLSNMAGGFPLRVNGVNILTSEALYQACRFPHLPEVQRLIIDQKSPMTAKMKSKPYRDQSRPDWDSIRVRIMRWCLRVKLAQNWTTFGDLLRSTDDLPIVELSKKDDFWGAKPQQDGTLVGMNVLGRLLMELREQLKRATGDDLKRVEPVPIDDFLLYGKPIGVVQAWRVTSPDLTDPDLMPPEGALWSQVGESPAEGAATQVASASALTEHPAPATQAIIEPTALPQVVEVSASVPPHSERGNPRRLIEVDLPIKRISAHARREKSIRHGHISTLHIWWARRPLAACRAVICAALWPDPADSQCPQAFRDAAGRVITEFARRACGQGKIGTPNLMGTCSEESLARWQVLSKPGHALDTKDAAHLNLLRFALLDFIADFADWDNSTVPEYLETARALTQAAHEALGGEPGTRPLVVDPFAGGGSIPLEALRVGADAFASDLNPVAVLLNKVVLEYIPKYGQRLADEVRKWGQWIKEQAEKELGPFYPKGANKATPIAYLWARTVTCEGPGCGSEVPLMRSLWLAKKGKRSVAIRLVPRPRAKRVDFEIIENAKAKDVGDGTVKRGSATCPCCGYTTPVASVRRQLKDRHGGASDANLYCIITTQTGEQGRSYRLPTEADLVAVRSAKAELEQRRKAHTGPFSLVPEETLDIRGIRHTWAMIYGIDTWGRLFTPRQTLALSSLCRLVREAGTRLAKEHKDGLAHAVQTCLGLAVDRQADFQSSLVTWTSGGEFLGHTFTRQAVPMVWDFGEGNPWADASGNWEGAIGWVCAVISRGVTGVGVGHSEEASATSHPLPDGAVNAVVTDPPYYDAVPYAYLSDFFYVWLRRSLGDLHPSLLEREHVPKDAEIVVDRPHELSNSEKDIAFYERELTKAFAEGRRILRPDGVAVIVFASKTTASWEAILQAVVDAGWTMTGSWPVDTEREARIAAQGQARLASSVHLVCRPRGPAGIGDWRDVLTDLPRRIHEWMPRLASEGIVGADAIFACLGPALEVYSRYSRVEKASGEQVMLKEYLEQVWASVSKEALSMIFAGADASGFDPDARLTAMWFWTLSTGVPADSNGESGDEEEIQEDDEVAGRPVKVSGFVLEYDAARKIAQGLGAHLEQLTSVVEVKGDKARLLAVSERARHLFGKEEGRAPARRAKVAKQKTLFDEADGEGGEEGSWGELNVPQSGATVLDRLHQAMILFAAGRGEALRRFLVEEGVGRDARFWRLAQALSALYPPGTEEKRWVDGVLGRKKGLGF